MSDEHTYEDLERDALFAIVSETERLANVGGWEWDIAKDLWTFSDNWLRIHGCSKRHLSTSELLPIAHPDDRQDIQRAFDKAVNEGTKYEIEHRIIRQDNGEERYIRACGIAKLDSEDKALQLYGSAQDITEQKMADQSFQESERRLKISTESGGIGLWELDLIDLTAWRSSTHDGIFGYDTLLPKWTFEMFLDHVVKEDRPIVEKTFGDALNKIRSWDFECRIVRKDGSLRWIWARGYPEFDADNQPIKMSGVVQDITDRKRAERALHEINETLKEAQSVAKIGSWWYDPEIQMSIWTDEMFHIFGLEPQPEALSYDEHRKIIHPDDWECFDSAVRRAVTDAIGYDLELRITLPSGKTRYINTRCKTEKDKQGVVKRLIGTAQDITESKTLLLQLEKRNTDLRLAQRIASIGTWTLDPEVGVPEWSDEIYRIYERDTKLGPHTLADYKRIYRGKYWERFNTAIQGAIKDGTPYDIELKLELPSGNVKWVHAMCEPGPELGPKWRKIRGTIQDISERKKAEIKIKESEERFKLAIEFANDGLFDWNLISNEIYYSPVWKRILGYEDHELPNDFSVWENLTDPKDVKRSWKMQNDLIDRKRDRFEMEFRMKHKDGHWVDILSRANAIFNEDNKAIRIIGTHVDISQRKILEERLRQSQKMESIGTLAGGIAHDFNNILSSVIGFTELALDNAEKGSSIEDSLKEIYSSGKRARDLVKQILAFSRQSDEVIKPIQIDTIAKEVFKLLRASIPTTIQIKQDIKKDLTVMGNPTQVHQVFMNICTNAAQAMEDGGILEVSIKDIVIDKDDGLKDLIPGEYAEIKVSDNGMGIDPGNMDKIFDPFFTTKEVGKGTGMGLALVHGIIKSYNGTITVESMPNQGSVFKVYLPLIRSRREADLCHPEILPTGDERILLIDDEAPIVKMSSQILQKLGYEVVFRTSSIKALELFRSEPDDFDLVITDMTMPEMTGDQLAAELMSVRRDIPVILCTGYSDKITDKTAATLGIKAFAYKPVSKANLAKTVRKVLDEAK